MLSERSGESDRITALELGVDDYLVKPVSSKELVLRSKALLRRSGPLADRGSRAWSLGDRRLRLDVDRHKLFADERKVSLTAAEWRVFIYLLRKEGTVASRESIMEDCFQYSADVYDRVIDTHVKNLRRKLRCSAWIETVKGFGYRFAGDPAGVGAPAP